VCRTDREFTTIERLSSVWTENGQNRFEIHAAHRTCLAAEAIGFDSDVLQKTDLQIRNQVILLSIKRKVPGVFEVSATTSGQDRSTK